MGGLEGCISVFLSGQRSHKIIREWNSFYLLVTQIPEDYHEGGQLLKINNNKYKQWCLCKYK